MRASEQVHVGEIESTSLQFMEIHVCHLVVHVTDLFIEGLFTKMFCSKMYNFDLISKLFTGCIEWAFRHLHVKYLIDWMILNLSHKLAYNYLNLTNRSGLQRIFT